jgi:chromosome segregation ATPase
LREAKAATGVGQKRDEPPPEVVNNWEKEKLPSRVEDIEVMNTELQAQADCMDTVDPRIVADYKKLKETITELQQDIDRRETTMADALAKMEEVKDAWLTSLTSLVERINTKFSAHFASMGFAGEVGLSRGQHENDFENYGVKIRVKYRDSEPLQELTAHHQSGGERSVATALYMLALQELTTVPFRCVDEINQGMDAKNERRVFELLVRTSCSESSAQYFLLTPKLLPGLNYSPRMNMLVVNNGPHMCHHKEWDMASFHTRAAQAS